MNYSPSGDQFVLRKVVKEINVVLKKLMMWPVGDKMQAVMI
jgi:hypothetical protein